MLRSSFVIRRMGSSWLLVTCLTASVLITSALVTALAGFYTSAIPDAVGRELARSGDMSMTISGGTSASGAGPLARNVAAALRHAFGPVPCRLYQAGWSDNLGLPGPHPAGTVPILQAAAAGGLAAHARLSSGSWPAAPQPGQPVPAALPAGAAADLGLRVGSQLRLRDLSSGVIVRLRVTGLYRPRDPAEPYWKLDFISPSGLTVGSGFASYGPAAVSPAAFTATGGAAAALSEDQVSFVALPDPARVEPSQLNDLAARVSKVVSSFQSAGQVTATTQLPAALTNVAKGLVAARSLLLISSLQLVLLAAAGLALAGRLLASHRDEECALLASRGAARWQLIRPSLAEAAIVCSIAAAGGLLAGNRLSSALLSGVTGQAARVPLLSTSTVGAAAGVLLVCLAIVLWPALRPPDIGAVRIRRGRHAAAAAVVAAGADVALVALALLAVRELRSYSAAAHAGGGGIDPVIAVAPALALVGLSILPLRLLPLAARGLERVTARGSRLSTAMANWEISRRPVRQSGPALLVILAVGTSTLALAQYQSWQQSVRDQAAFATGAQVRVDLAESTQLSGVAAIAGLPGVSAAMPASQLGISASGSQAQLVAIDARRAASVVTLRKDLSALPASKLWRSIATPAMGGIALPGRPRRLEISASLAGGRHGSLGPVSATVTFQDAYGVAYAVPAGSLPADGRQHSLIANVGAGAAYPLRLLGVALTYSLPPHPGSPSAVLADANAYLHIAGLSASPAAAGSFPVPFASGLALAGWRPTVSAPGLGVLAATLKGSADKERNPIVLSWSHSRAGAQLRIQPGNGPALPAAKLRQLDALNLPAVIAITAPAPLQVLPAIASAGFLNAGKLAVGSTVTVNLGNTAVTVQIVAEVAQFPTIPGGGALVVDQAALQDLTVSTGTGPLPLTSWWLSTAGGAVPRGLPPGSVATDAAAQVRLLRGDPLSAAPVQAAVAVAGAAALLAALGFCVSVAASARARRAQRAVLAALGVPGTGQAGLFCLEEVMLSLPAAAIGLLVGVALAHLLIPAITLTATAGAPIPPVLVTLPLAPVLAIALIVPAIPVLAAAISAVRQPDPAAELRAAEAAG